MMDLANRINLDRGLICALDKLKKEKQNKINRLVEKCRRKGNSALRGENPLIKLAVCLEYAERYTKKRYEELGISEDIFYKTMSDIKIWCENNKNEGLKNSGWIFNHLNAELFRLGRLQFQLYKINERHFDYSMLPFERGENMIYVHIPQGEKLIYAECIKSVEAAKSFFEKVFPDFKYRFFFCESWLLYENNYEFMQTSSNILQFQAMFENVLNIEDGKQAIERIFGKKHMLKRQYPEETALQKSAKEFMLNGGKMGMGIGIIEK